MKAPVLFIWSASSPNGRRNLQRGLDTQTWGFKQDAAAYHEDIEYVLFGHDHSGGSPRKDVADWQSGTASLVLCERTVPPYVGRAPHWPDEHEAGRVIYPYRFGLTPVAMAADIPLVDTGLLGADGTEAMRLAAIQNRGIRATIDLTVLMTAMGIVLTPDNNTPDLSQTAGMMAPTFPAARGVRGAGRSNDPAFNRAVERHAVDLATAYLAGQGWHVTELGKPFDLVCTKPDGSEKHVEVKGTTGAGADVLYTPNEVHHFRTCPYGADLIVVRDIEVDRSTTPYSTSKGDLLHIPGYAAPAADLQATGWLGRVVGW